VWQERKKRRFERLICGEIGPGENCEDRVDSSAMAVGELGLNRFDAINPGEDRFPL
jgi:hypothetical protein